jgi:hypothetical protein
MYAQGDGVKQDSKEAAKWFRKSADQGSEQAQLNLGLMYFRGQGVKQNKREAFKWFGKAAAQGSDEAIKTLEILGTHMPAKEIH